MTGLIKHGVNVTLFKMAFPMLAGTIAVNAYNLTDTWFVSRLGTGPLAAMSFTFPVVMVVSFCIMGLATGTMAVVAHALGEGNRTRAARLTTHAFILALLLSLILMVAGLKSVSPLFTILGASGGVLDMVAEYMTIWYGGIISVTVLMILQNAIMGTGDTKSASITMMIGTVLNIILDPVMIFGWIGFPALGIAGAALATVTAQIFSLIYSFYILKKKHGLIKWKGFSVKSMIDSWNSILKLGVPSILSGILTPLSLALVTRIIAGFGPAAVAAMGASGRLEMFAFMIPMSLGMSLVPFIAQNYGAGRFDRILEARSSTMRFALIFGAATTVIFNVFSPFMAKLFSNDPTVIYIMVLNLRIVSFGYGMTEVFRYSTFCLTGIHRPLSSAFLNMTRSMLLLIPLSYLGAVLWGVAGVFWGRLATDAVSGLIGIKFSKKIILMQQDTAKMNVK